MLVAAVANYREVKGLDVLVDAFAAAAATAPGLRLILIGEGPTRPSLEAQVRSLGQRHTEASSNLVPLTCHDSLRETSQESTVVTHVL